MFVESLVGRDDRTEALGWKVLLSRTMPPAKTRTDADDEAKSKLAGNRPKRCTESRTLESPAFLDFIQRLRNNTLECDAGGKVLRLKRFISANSGPKTLHAVLDALEENTTAALPLDHAFSLLNGTWPDVRGLVERCGWSPQSVHVERVHRSLSRLILHAQCAPQD